MVTRFMLDVPDDLQFYLSRPLVRAGESERLKPPRALFHARHICVLLTSMALGGELRSDVEHRAGKAGTERLEGVDSEGKRA